MNYDDFLKIPRGCPFCNTPKSEIIAENEHAFITFSLSPYHKDHILVLPKRHIEKILDIKSAEEDDVYALIRKAMKMLHRLGYKDLSVLVRDGDDSMKTVSHMHYNIIPNTRLGDIDHQGKKRMILTKEAAEAMCKRIKAVAS